jgi:hypothetical protein
MAPRGRPASGTRRRPFLRRRPLSAPGRSAPRCTCSCGPFVLRLRVPGVEGLTLQLVQFSGGTSVECDEVVLVLQQVQLGGLWGGCHPLRAPSGKRLTTPLAAASTRCSSPYTEFLAPSPIGDTVPASSLVSTQADAAHLAPAVASTQVRLHHQARAATGRTPELSDAPGHDAGRGAVPRTSTCALVQPGGCEGGGRQSSGVRRMLPQHAALPVVVTPQLVAQPVLMLEKRRFGTWKMP